METEKRRWELLTLLRDGSEPVTGNELARRFGVSRQVIVQDIAILRAAGAEVLATPQGYMFPRLKIEPVVRAIVACRHSLEQIEEELVIIVDLGGKVLDVIVEHPVYGEMRGNLMIASRRDLSIFLEHLSKTEARPLSALTDGVHLHTIEAPAQTIIDEIVSRLDEAGFIIR
jgi:hypothetical protein